jgi:hypothetical protein
VDPTHPLKSGSRECPQRTRPRTRMTFARPAYHAFDWPADRVHIESLRGGEIRTNWVASNGLPRVWQSSSLNGLRTTWRTQRCGSGDRTDLAHFEPDVFSRRRCGRTTSSPPPLIRTGPGGVGNRVDLGEELIECGHVWLIDPPQAHVSKRDSLFRAISSRFRHDGRADCTPCRDGDRR